MRLKFILASAMVFSAAFAHGQASVTTGTNKYVLLMEETGAWCGFCPDGKTVLDQILTSTPHAIAVSFHERANGWTPAYENLQTTAGDTYVNTAGYLGSPSVGGYPAATIDNMGGPTSTNADTFVGQNRGYWPSEVTTRLGVSPTFQVTMTHSFVQATRTATINVTAKALTAITGDYNINVIVTEDSIPSVAPDGSTGNLQHSYLYTQTGQPYYHRGFVITAGQVWGLPSDTTGYYHDLVVRDMLGGTWGTTGVIATNAVSGSSYTKTYTYAVPAGYALKHLRFTAYVQKNNTGNASDRWIANSIQAKLDTTATATGVEQITSSELNLEVSPNPASNMINVKAYGADFGDTKVTIDNTIGQTVLAKEYTTNSNLFNENISLSSLSNGIYFVNFYSEGIKTSKKIIVNH